MFNERRIRRAVTESQAALDDLPALLEQGVALVGIGDNLLLVDEAGNYTQPVVSVADDITARYLLDNAVRCFPDNRGGGAVGSLRVFLWYRGMGLISCNPLVLKEIVGQTFGILLA